MARPLDDHMRLMQLLDVWLVDSLVVSAAVLESCYSRHLKLPAWEGALWGAVVLWVAHSLSDP